MASSLLLSLILELGPPSKESSLKSNFQRIKASMNKFYGASKMSIVKQKMFRESTTKVIKQIEIHEREKSTKQFFFLFVKFHFSDDNRCILTSAVMIRVDSHINYSKRA